MKKSLLVLSILFLSVSFAGISAADLNPYAYDLKVLSTDAENFKVTLQYSLNAPASSVKIYAKDGTGTSYLLKEFGSRSATTYSVEIDLLDAMENKGVPAGEDLSWYIDVARAARTVNAETCGRKINFRSPFSIDIDNNPNSPYFGRIVTTQANNNETRGVRAYKPNFTQIGSNYIGSVVSFPSGNWYNNTHLTPYRIRVLQDGTGRIFVSSADVGQATYMWQVDPANLNNWSVFLTSNEMREKTGHPEEDDTMANHNFDFRKKSNGEWELLLLSSSVNSKSTNCSSGYSYCGVYALGSDLSKKNYTQYIENKEGAPHQVIDDWFVASVLTGNAQFDPNGDILYSSYHQNTNPEESALIHHQIKTDEFSSGYDAFERLRRKNTATGAIRYSGDFSKLAVANGGLAKEVSICTPNHSREYLTISSIEAVDMITTTHNTAYIVDFAWDYASNLYACVRNSDDSSLRGVWVIVCNLNGAAVSTPARDKFSIPCQSGKTYTISCSAQDGLGSVTGAGTYESCTKRTVTATPKDNNYRFSHWTDQSGKTVSTNAEYTFYLVKDVTLTAHFIPSVFEVTWWNLFQNGEDIGQAEDCTCGSYTACNERLWRLFQVDYNNYLKGNTWGTQVDPKGVGSKLSVLGFFAAGNNLASKTNDFLRQKLDAYFKDNTKLFYWLGQYIQNTPTKKTIDAYASYNGGYMYETYDLWGWFLQAFINRQDKLDNQSFNGTLSSVAGHPAKQFSTYGQPAEWRPYWTDATCGLSMTMNYSDAMPITWTQNACPSGTIKPYGTSITHNPSSWYKWNTGGANQLLAWREGGTNPVNNRIVHHVDKSMALYATYVDKHLQEDDPAPANQYDAKNNDILDLLANDNHGSTLHNVTVDRKFPGGMYSTICLPFDLPVANLPTQLKDADIMAFIGVTETNDVGGEAVAILNFVSLKEYWQLRDPSVTDLYMEAGIPYLICPKRDVTDAYLTYSDLMQWRFFDSSKKPLSETYNGVTFQGVFNPTTLSYGDYILVADNRLAKVTNTSGQLKGFRGYFKIEDAYLSSLADNGRLYLSMKKPVTSSVPVAPEAEKLEAPKARKIMRDGQIYILRGDEVYTITGHRVK